HARVLALLRRDLRPRRVGPRRRLQLRQGSAGPDGRDEPRVLARALQERQGRGEGVMRSLLLLLLLLLLGCASTPPPATRSPEPEVDFEYGGQHYKVTREYGSTSYLLWRGEGITWDLVSETPGADSLSR